jgi:hypothetical protein
MGNRMVTNRQATQTVTLLMAHLRFEGIKEGLDIPQRALLQDHSAGCQTGEKK